MIKIHQQNRPRSQICIMFNAWEYEIKRKFIAK